MTVLELNYPSNEFPAEPRVSLRVPENWTAVSTPRTTLAATAPEVEGFRPNVVVVISRRAPGMVPGVALDELAVEAQQRPAGALSDPFTVELNGREWDGCDLSWHEPEVGRIIQMHLLSVAEAPIESALPFLVQVTGSCLVAREEQDVPRLRDVMSSIVVTPWAAV